MNTRRIAVIPARGGSKRIKNKNIIDFCGKPMIYYSLNAAKESGLFDVIHVSTDSEDIRRVSEELGFPVTFMRIPELADDHTGVMPVLQWVLQTFKRAHGEEFDDACLLMPTAPLLQASDLKSGYDIYVRNGGKKPLLAVCQYQAPIEWAFTRDERGNLTPCQPGMFKVRSQDLEAKYFDTGTFCFFSVQKIMGSEPNDLDFTSYILPRDKTVDIDDEADLLLAETLFLGRNTRR